MTDESPRRPRPALLALAVVALVAAVVALAWPEPAPPQPLAVGDRAPDVTVVTAGAAARSLLPDDGRRAVLVFYRGHW